jgi:hypothetical protein
MDPSRFDHFTRTLTATPSRRGVTRALAGLTLSGMLMPLLGFTDTESRRRRKKKGKGKKNKGGHRSPTCTDGKKNGSETGVDCGGPNCPRCATGQGCVDRADCASAICSIGTCQACPSIGAPCGDDANGDCYCEELVDGPNVCTSEEDTSVYSCFECPANTVCTTGSIPGRVDCRKLCGAP